MFSDTLYIQHIQLAYACNVFCHPAYLRQPTGTGARCAVAANISMHKIFSGPCVYNLFSQPTYTIYSATLHTCVSVMEREGDVQRQRANIVTVRAVQLYTCVYVCMNIYIYIYIYMNICIYM